MDFGRRWISVLGSHFPQFVQDPGEGNVCLQKRFLLHHGSCVPVGINSSAIRKITSNPSERKPGARLIQFLLLISSRRGSELELWHLNVPRHEKNDKTHPAGQHLSISPDQLTRDHLPTASTPKFWLTWCKNLLEVIPSLYPSSPLSSAGGLRLSPLPRETPGNDSSCSSEISRNKLQYLL